MDKHPHYSCEACASRFHFNSLLQWVFLLAIPFVSPERSIALAILILSCNSKDLSR